MRTRSFRWPNPERTNRDGAPENGRGLNSVAIVLSGLRKFIIPKRAHARDRGRSGAAAGITARASFRCRSARIWSAAATGIEALIKRDGRRDPRIRRHFNRLCGAAGLARYRHFRDGECLVIRASRARVFGDRPGNSIQELGGSCHVGPFFRSHHYRVPGGTDRHNYEPLRRDIG